MPRPNQPRALHSESNLAKRIAYERELRDWSYDGTASRMTEAGCAIQASAIYKIEKGDPPRRISVDELVAFAAIFGVDVEHLLLPIETVRREAATSVMKDLYRSWDDIAEAATRMLDSWGRYAQIAAEDEGLDAFESDGFWSDSLEALNSNVSEKNREFVLQTLTYIMAIRQIAIDMLRSRVATAPARPNPGRRRNSKATDTSKGKQ